MSKTLFLLRHAKSSWDEPGLVDHDRPLSKRGIKAAPLMARAMVQRNWLPDFALVSSAMRTQQTWQLAREEFPARIEAHVENSIYEAPAEAIANAIRKIPERVSSLIVIGHNPGLEDISTYLASPGSDEDALFNLRQKFPTAALARFSYDSEWKSLSQQSAGLTHFLTPRQMTPQT